MTNPKPLVVLGLLGPSLDAGMAPERWEHWRPTVALFQHDDLAVARLELLYQPKFASLSERVAADVAQISPETVVTRSLVPIADPWDFEEVYEALHGFARRYPFEPEREDYLVHITTGTHVAQICLFLLTESRDLPARLVQTSPPTRAERLVQGSYAIIDLDLSRYDRIASRFSKEQEDAVSLLKSGIDTRNPAFNRLIEEIETVAAHSRVPILLTGPTGAGKTRLAKRIYELKKARRQLSGAYVEVNCATLRGEQAMSTLFGHVKGAFTGAQGDRPGLLRAADGGLLFLDEVGELGLDEQAMLLRALESKVFLPLGSDREAKSDFLLLAGTNRELPARVAAGLFREDLLARINTWTFRLPGLAERREDIAPNLDFEIDAHARATGTRVAFNKEARDRFLAFATSLDAAWSGNFRDLNAAVTRMATLARGGRIGVDLVDGEIARLRTSWKPSPQPGATNAAVRFLGEERAAALDPFDRVQLEEVLRTCERAKSLSDAGRRLFAQSRAKKTSVNDADRLRKYLLRFGLSWREIAARTE